MPYTADLSVLQYCATPGACTPIELPDLYDSNCYCVPLLGRINDLWLVPCTENGAGTAFTEAELANITTWTGLVTAGKLRRFGKGIGGIDTKDNKTFDLGGCSSVPTLIESTHAITYKVYCIDKGDEFKSHQFVNAIRQGALSKYNMFARLCGDADVLILIGVAGLIDAKFVIPEGNDEPAYMQFEFAKKSLNLLTPFRVTGLGAAIASN